MSGLGYLHTTMSIVSLHTRRHLFRHMIAAGMAALYLVMVFSPLASFAMHGTKSGARVIRECSGDCNICGCSPESRAAHTCCCARKKQLQDHTHDHDQDGASDCCSTKPEQHARVHEDSADSTPDCCMKEAAPQDPVIISCSCPCGNGKQTALSISSSSEVLLYHFTEQFTIPHTDTTFSNLTPRLTSRLGEPPDPPPQNS
jgi:hypothetical protein